MVCGIKDRAKFVDWCPTGVKCGINYKKQINFEDDPPNIYTFDPDYTSNGTEYKGMGYVSICSILNTSSTSDVLKKLISNISNDYKMHNLS